MIVGDTKKGVLSTAREWVQEEVEPAELDIEGSSPELSPVQPMNTTKQPYTGHSKTARGSHAKRLAAEGPLGAPATFARLAAMPPPPAPSLTSFQSPVPASDGLSPTTTSSSSNHNSSSSTTSSSATKTRSGSSSSSSSSSKTRSKRVATSSSPSVKSEPTPGPRAKKLKSSASSDSLPTTTSPQQPLKLEQQKQQQQQLVSSRHVPRVAHPGATGLRNLGNTCYMNSTLQALSALVAFRSYMMEDATSPLSLPPPFSSLPPPAVSPDSSSRPTRSSNRSVRVSLARELALVLRQLWSGETRSHSPDALLMALWRTVPRFKGYAQQDAQEFLRCALDRIHVELTAAKKAAAEAAAAASPDTNISDSPPSSSPSSPSPPEHMSDPTPSSTATSIVTDCFQGRLRSVVTCLNCSVPSATRDPFLDLSLSIPAPVTGSGRRGRRDAKAVPLTTLLTGYTTEERLGESERYVCSCTGTPQDATKKMAIEMAPSVLVLHLKRFRWGSRSKVDTPVSFPVTALNMAPYMASPPSKHVYYDLVAVVSHHGSSTGSGHYTAAAFNNLDGQWYDFNDSHVSPTTIEAVAQRQAYLLFYGRRG